MNQLFIGIIVAMGLSGYFYYTTSQAKIEELVSLNQAYEVRDSEQRAAIEAIQANLENTSRSLTILSQQNQQYEAEMNEYLDIFRRHNLARIASARPGQVELRVNNGTKEVFDGIEADSQRISNLND